LVLHVTQQLVLALLQLQFQQQHHLLIQFSLLLLSLRELFLLPLSLQPSSPALRRHHLQWLLLAQPSSRPFLQALVPQAERHASTHHVQHEHEHGRLVDR
jgi:hypothetical protein